MKHSWTPESCHSRFINITSSVVSSPSSAALANVKNWRAWSYTQIEEQTYQAIQNSSLLGYDNVLLGQR